MHKTNDTWLQYDSADVSRCLLTVWHYEGWAALIFNLICLFLSVSTTYRIN